MNATFLPHIAELVFNRPLLIVPDKALVILAVLQDRIAPGAGPVEVDESARFVLLGPEHASRFDAGGFVEDKKTGRLEPFTRTENGVAVIPVMGSLVNRGAWTGASSGLTSYEGLNYSIRRAVADPKSHTIAFDINSGGGEAVGAFELADMIRAAGEQKRTVAIVNGLAGSAAYALASGAQRVVTTPSSMLGSIGVAFIHMDTSKRLQNMGIQPTLIFAGKHKMDANPFEPLGEGVAEGIAKRVQATYDVFVKTVARNRGERMPAKRVAETEGRMYGGKEARKIGLADDVGTFQDVVGSLRPPRGSRAVANSGATMFGFGRAVKARIEDEDGNERAQTMLIPDAAAQAEGQRLIDQAKAEGRADGEKAATERLQAILADERSKGRERMAIDLALRSPNMSAQDVLAFVANIPAEAPAAEAGPAQAPQAPTVAERAKAAGLDRVGGADHTRRGQAAASGSPWDKHLDRQRTQFERRQAARAPGGTRMR